MTHKRVLLADGFGSVLDTVAALLRGSFDIVGMVSDGRTALEAILKLEPDLVILDISMPGLSGMEVARELKSRVARPSRMQLLLLCMGVVHCTADCCCGSRLC